MIHMLTNNGGRVSESRNKQTVRPLGKAKWIFRIQETPIPTLSCYFLARVVHSSTHQLTWLSSVSILSFSWHIFPFILLLLTLVLFPHISKSNSWWIKIIYWVEPLSQTFSNAVSCLWLLPLGKFKSKRGEKIGHCRYKKWPPMLKDTLAKMPSASNQSKEVFHWRRLRTGRPLQVWPAQYVVEHFMGIE